MGGIECGCYEYQSRAHGHNADSNDIVMEGETPGDNSEKAALIIRPLAQVGLTWWLEAVWSTPESQGGLEGMRTRILQGPPRIEE
jgi:hypothetical protein